MDVQLIVTGSNKHNEYGMRTYHQYLEYLFDNRNPPDPVEQFAKGYEDFLQCPLQVGDRWMYFVLHHIIDYTDWEKIECNTTISQNGLRMLEISV
jgi:hypothetical protein